MKKCELVLGNVVKAYKGEEEFVITNINEEAVILNDILNSIENGEIDEMQLSIIEDL